MSPTPEAAIHDACIEAADRLKAARQLSSDPRFNGLLDMLVRINVGHQQIAASLDDVGQQLDQLSVATTTPRAA